MLVLQLHMVIEASHSALVVTASGGGLVATTPSGPGQAVLRWRDRVPNQPTEQATHFWNGQWKQLVAQAPPFSATRARMTVSMACAKSAKVMCRRQPSHLRTAY